MAQGEYWWVVVESPEGLSTPAVYAEFDALHAGSPVPDPEIPADLMEALRNSDLPGVAEAMGNDLEPAALRLRPELGEVLTAGVAAGALGSLLSGSGPSCLFLCEDKEHAVDVVTALRDVGLGPVSMARGPVAGATVERTG
jgi:4-diphosphocytidyl-2-C-methyl-D-erythritol kinase